MFDWLKRRSEQPQPEARWSVIVDEAGISVQDDKGERLTIPKTDITGVAIETNDTGPWGADVWWLLFGMDDRLACAFPQGATGEQVAVDYMMGMQGFDHAAMIAAMSSTRNDVFPVWRKPS